MLVISDQHYPYNHSDIHAFLKALKAKYKPDLVINIGDELDYHAMSFHDSNPDLFSAGDELQVAIDRLKPLYRLFPRMKILESNHGSLVYRKGKFHGMPRDVFKSYREVLGAPKGWSWHFDLTVKLSDGSLCYFHHGKSSSGIKLSQSMGMKVVQGHFHEKFAVEYWGNPTGLYWSMQVGCLIDNSSYAFEYNRTNLKRPVIGCGVILEGQPRLEPMILDKNGRWIGRLS